MVGEQFVNMLSASNEWTPLTMIKGGGDQDDEEQQIRSLNNNNNNNSSNSKMMLGTKGDEGRRKVMEKASQEQMEKAPLKCPRCDSTNTKFCYYNNYSLSQPRHFCKACKRYWTRGGTLRTVPVGGGCRKNKRVIRRVINPNLSSPNPTLSSTACNDDDGNNNNNSPSNTTTTTTHQPLNPSSSGSHLMSPLLYGLPTNLTNAFPFSSSYDNNNHHQFNGLGFSSAGMILGQRNGYSTNTTTPKQILHDLISNSNPFHGSNPNTTSTATLHHHQHQHKFSFETLFPYDLDLQIKGVDSHENEGDVYIKDDSTVKLECQVQNGYHHHQQQQQQDMEEPDPAILWNANSNGNSTIGVNWLDPNYSNQLGLI